MSTTENARALLDEYDELREEWSKRFDNMDSDEYEDPSATECERYTDSLTNFTEDFALALRSLLEPRTQYMVRIVTEETFQGLVTGYVGPFETRMAAVEYIASKADEADESLGVERYVEELYAP